MTVIISLEMFFKRTWLGEQFINIPSSIYYFYFVMSSLGTVINTMCILNQSANYVIQRLLIIPTFKGGDKTREPESLFRSSYLLGHCPQSPVFHHSSVSSSWDGWQRCRRGQHRHCTPVRKRSPKPRDQ